MSFRYRIVFDLGNQRFCLFHNHCSRVSCQCCRYQLDYTKSVFIWFSHSMFYSGCSVCAIMKKRCRSVMYERSTMCVVIGFLLSSGSIFSAKQLDLTNFFFFAYCWKVKDMTCSIGRLAQKLTNLVKTLGKSLAWRNRFFSLQHLYSAKCAVRANCGQSVASPRFVCLRKVVGSFFLQKYAESYIPSSNVPRDT